MNKYFDLYDTAPVGYFIVNGEGIIVEANKTAAKMLGVARESMVNKPLLDFIVPEFHGMFYDHRKQIFENGTSQVCELKMSREGGSTFWARIEANAAADPQGAPVCHAVMSDISERKRMEDALKESEERYRLLFNSGDDGILAFSLDKYGIPDRFISVNASACERYGYSRDEFLDMPASKLDDAEAFKKNVVPAIAELLKTGSATYESVHVTKTARRIPVEINSSIIDIKGEITVLSIVRDISERKRAERLQREIDEQFRALIEGSPDAHVINDIYNGVDRGFVDCNQAALKMLGMSYKEQLFAVNAADLSPSRQPDGQLSDEKYRAIVTECLKNGSSRFEWVYRRITGEGFYVEIVMTAVKYHDKIILHSVWRDITDRKRAEEALRNSEAMLKGVVSTVRVGLGMAADRVLEWSNEYFLGLLGYEKSEVIGKTSLLFYENEKEFNETGSRFYSELKEKGIAQVETVWKRKDGAVLDIYLTGFVIDKKSFRIIFGVLDITERKRMEREIARINRSLRMLSSVNEVLIHALDESALLEEVCRIVVESGGFLMAWVGFARNDEARTIQPAAHAGLNSGYIEAVKVTWADNASGRGPGGRAVRTGKTAISRDILADPDFAPWREEAFIRGYKSNIALPLISGGETLGELSIYSGETDAFDAKEVEILQEMTGDLAFGITALRTRAKQDMMVSALRESERRYRGLFEHMSEGLAYCEMVTENGKDVDWVYITVNKAFEDLTGLKDVSGRRVSDAVPGIRESDPGLFEAYGRVARTGIPEKFEVFVKALKMWFSVSVFSPQTGFFVAVFDTITARKKAEEVSAVFKMLNENAPVGFAYINREFRYIYINDTLAEINGLPKEEHIGRTVKEIVPDVWPKLEKLFNGILESGKPVINVEIKGETKSQPGRLRQWFVSYYPVIIGSERASGIGLIVEETTRTK